MPIGKGGPATAVARVHATCARWLSSDCRGGPECACPTARSTAPSTAPPARSPVTPPAAGSAGAGAAPGA